MRAMSKTNVEVAATGLTALALALSSGCSTGASSDKHAPSPEPRAQASEPQADVYLSIPTDIASREVIAMGRALAEEHSPVRFTDAAWHSPAMRDGASAGFGSESTDPAKAYLALLDGARDPNGHRALSKEQVDAALRLWLSVDRPISDPSAFADSLGHLVPEDRAHLEKVLGRQAADDDWLEPVVKTSYAAAYAVRSVSDVQEAPFGGLNGWLGRFTEYTDEFEASQAPTLQAIGGVHDGELKNDPLDDRSDAGIKAALGRLNGRLPKALHPDVRVALFYAILKHDGIEMTMDSARSGEKNPWKVIAESVRKARGRASLDLDGLSFHAPSKRTVSAPSPGLGGKAITASYACPPTRLRGKANLDQNRVVVDRVSTGSTRGAIAL